MRDEREGVHVAFLVHLCAVAETLGRHVVERADGVRLRLQKRASHRARDAEIGEVRATAVVHEDVLGFEIAVHNLRRAVVEVFHRDRDVFADAELREVGHRTRTVVPLAPATAV